MRNDQTGEYELVVGNPQLLSGFVILVLLCTAAFFLGYEVGQNTPRSAKQQADAAKNHAIERQHEQQTQQLQQKHVQEQQQLAAKQQEQKQAAKPGEKRKPP